MRLRPHLLAPLAAAIFTLGVTASANAAGPSFGATIGKFCGAQADLYPIDGRLTAAKLQSDQAKFTRLEGVIAQAATKSGVAKKSSPLYKTYSAMEGELLYTGHVFSQAATDLTSEKRLTKAQITMLAKNYIGPLLDLEKQFKAIGATACSN